MMSGLARLLKRLPPTQAHAIAGALGSLEYGAPSPFRAGLRRAIAQGSAHFGERWDPAELGPRLAGNLVRWRLRDTLLDGAPESALDDVIQVAGLEHFETAMALGKGVILLGSHFGAHMFAPHWLARMGRPIRLFMERPRTVSKLLEREFQTEGPVGQKGLFISRSAPAAEGAKAVMKAARILKSGMVIYIAADVRWEGRQVVEARFLGKSHRFSTTWVLLASLTQAPVVPVFCVMRPNGAHKLEFLPQQAIPPGLTSPDACCPYVQAALDRIEDWVRLYPCNSNDYFFWDDPKFDKGARRAQRARRIKAELAGAEHSPAAS